MYVAIANKDGEFLLHEHNKTLVFGALSSAATLTEDNRDIWDRLYPGLDALLEQGEAAILPHPDYQLVGIQYGCGIYALNGDPEYRMIGDRVFATEDAAPDDLENITLEVQIL